ncbi:MAG: DUF3579 domain-containing protein [Gammaproteobacteria bacterium]|nr:DUF3579 domain-containing protein [Gammaproteobacteria bacterium]
MEKKPPKIIIEGITESGENFRPSDWAERMSGSLSTFRKRHIRYSPLLQPSMRGGHKCVILDPRLKQSNPKLFESILKFAEKNKLKICKDSKEADTEKE